MCFFKKRKAAKLAAEKAAEEKKAAEVKEEKVKEPKPEPVAPQAEPVEAPEANEEQAEEKKVIDFRNYHVVKRAKDNKWEVKYAGGSKAIKLFDTQKEAIEYTKVMAERQGGSMLVHNSKGAAKGRIKAK